MAELAQVDALDQEGRALCHLLQGKEAGGVCVVDGALPGEQVWIELLRRKRRGTRQAHLLSIHHAKRLTPACPHVEHCGGCRTQQWLYQEELAWKQQTLERHFKAFDVPVSPILASPQRFAYRNKMEWSFAQDRAGKRFLGLHGRGVRGVVDIQTCALVRPWCSLALEVVRSWWVSSELPAFHPHRAEGVLRSITFREGFRSGDRMAILLIDDRGREAIEAHLSALIVSLQPLCPNLVLRIQIAYPGHPTRFEQRVCMGRDELQELLCVGESPLELRISAPAFSQPNPMMAEKMYRAILHELDPQRPLLDLFAGTGTIGLLAAQAGLEVYAIEQVPEACVDARMNAERNGLAERYQMLCGDASELVHQLPCAGAQVMVDPPRAGCGEEVCAWLLEQHPARILYLSCNPRSQVRDLQQLCAGYEIERVQPFDQFPNTPHVENLVVLGARDP